MSSRGGGAGSKRKHTSTGSSASRVQQKKLQSKAAKRSSAAAARQPSAAAEQQLADSLFFDSDDDDGDRSKRGRGDDDILIRGPRGSRDEDDDDDDGARDEHEAAVIDPFAAETPDEKRVRLARDFLSKIEQDVDAEAEAQRGDDGDELSAEEDEEERRGITRDAAIDRKLKASLQAQQGKLKSFVAHARYDASSFPPAASSQYMRVLGGHRKGGATCISMTEDCAAMFTGGKDTNLIAWDVETGAKLRTMYGNRGGKYAHLPNNAQGHTDHVMAVCVSTDGNLLASGSRDHTVKIWDPRANYACVKTFGGHKGPVSAVSFRLGTHELFTASWDRTIRLYNIDQFAFVETLYGHTSEVNGLDCLYRQRCLSVSSDKTSRLWKIAEESQLMFRASVFCESLDCVAMINEEQFITGGQDGTVAAWINTKKKPTSVIQAAHPRPTVSSADGAGAAAAATAAASTAAEPAPPQGRWINSVGAQRFTDVCFSGSSDGYLNLYCLESSGRLTNKLNLLHRIPVGGHLNGLVSDARDGRFVAVATGKEHRLGRWEHADDALGISRATCGIALVSLAGVERVRAQREEEAAEGERKEGAAADADEADEADMEDSAGAPRRAANGHHAAAAMQQSKRNAFAGDDEADEAEEEDDEPRFGVPAQQSSSSATVSAYSVGSGSSSSARKPSALQQAKMAAKKPTATVPRRGGRGGARGGRGR